METPYRFIAVIAGLHAGPDQRVCQLEEGVKAKPGLREEFLNILSRTQVCVIGSRISGPTILSRIAPLLNQSGATDESQREPEGGANCVGFQEANVSEDHRQAERPHSQKGADSKVDQHTQE